MSICNCVSTALGMLKFSSESLIGNAGYDNFDYIVVVWLPSAEVLDYLGELEGKHGIRVVEHETNPKVGYVPNLRAMKNRGFDEGFRLNDYCGAVDTDMYFGKNWLKNLMKYLKEDEIVNSTHISRITGPNIITTDLGLPELGRFDIDGFNKIYDEIYEDRLEAEEERGGWRATNTLPYLIHRKYWERCGPWELTLAGGEPPDVRFFRRCHDAGARFTMSRSSIVYHHEAVERRGRRPKGAEHLREEG